MTTRLRRAAEARPKSLSIQFPTSTRPPDGELVPPTLVPSRSRLVAVAEIAGLFHKSPETVKRKLRDGDLPGFKFANSWYMREDDLLCAIQDALERRKGDE